MNTEIPERTEHSYTFQQKVWLVCSITSLFVAIIWFFQVTFSVFLLILAGALIALFFHGFAELIQRKVRMSEKAALLTSVILTFAIIISVFWFMGATVQQQITDLAKTLPSTVNNAKKHLATTALGQKFLERTSSQEVSDEVYTFFSKFFNNTFGVFTDAYVVLFLGLFFTAAPHAYINGFMRLIPYAAKRKTRYTLEKIAFTLTKWLKGQILAMVAIAVLKGVALTILGVPMAIALALIAGILNFIPNFGPLISMFPAILIALTQSVNKAIAVAIVYLLLQIIEGNLITPSIQQKLIKMPAALIIIAQLFMGLLAGAWGLILATPIVAIVIVVIDETYVKRIDRDIKRIK